MDFVAIDFETANNNANSACQLGLVCVRNSEIVNEACWLIRPPRVYFSPRNIAIHGIHPQQVAQAPTMEGLWANLAGMLDGQIVVAHNARFDIGVLIHSLAAYDIACPNLEFACTRQLARRTWPGKARYGLRPLGDWLGIQFEHHDALEDARCCAKIALAVAQACDIHEFALLEKELQLSRGAYRQGQIASPKMLGKRSKDQSFSPARTSTDRWGFPSPQAKRTAGALDASAVLSASANSRPFHGKNIVLLGPLRGLDLPASRQLICDLGGNCQNQIAPNTHYVVACGTSLDAASSFVCQSLSQDASSHAEANSLSGIRLLSERQFRALLPGGKVSWR